MKASATKTSQPGTHDLTLNTSDTMMQVPDFAERQIKAEVMIPGQSQLCAGQNQRVMGELYETPP